MKRSLVGISLLALLSMLTFVSPLSAESRESERLYQGKITKNEAQHIALKKYPAAKINNCELKQAGDHSVWLIELTQTGEQHATKVQVDGKSGAITAL